jgi:hypothetical protein
MKKLEIPRRAENHRRKRIIPLSGMQTPDVVKTVLRYPRRLEELLDMLGDSNLSIRGRAAATLARLAESHPESLLKAMPRLREYLDDDSDYVRWHLVYAFGEIGVRASTSKREYWADVFQCMTDDSRIVRMIAGKAAVRLAAKHPDAVTAFFREIQQPVPPELMKFLPAEGSGSQPPHGASGQ